MTTFGDVEDTFRTELRSMREELDKIERQLEGLTKERNALKERHDTLEKYVAMTFQGGKGSDEQLAAQMDREIEANDRMTEEGTRIPEVVRATVLCLAKIWPDDMYYKDILERVQEGGTRVGGKTPAYNLIAHMTRFPDLIERTTRGRYRYRPRSDSGV